VQEFSTKLYDGTEVKGKNIIATINLEASDRVLFAAHWDSRLWADNDKDATLHKTPVLGANDGASGVGVLMEMARAIRQKPTKQGIDFIFFDLEDQGAPSWADYEAEDQKDWCLGSQYWSQNKHIPFYNASYGILLDMVGYSAARFTKEFQSMGYAGSIMDKVWAIAKAKGYGNIFVDKQSSGVMDDHIWVNHYAKIPMIDIVQNDPDRSFFPHWHTSTDDMRAISKQSLKKVGEVCLTAIYSAQ
jgi:Zn-dependent M28 family amino/carboxypeptidase